MKTIERKEEPLWADNCFDGPPPQGYSSWKAWVEYSTSIGLFKGVRITARNKKEEKTKTFYVWVRGFGLNGGTVSQLKIIRAAGFKVDEGILYFYKMIDDKGVPRRHPFLALRDWIEVRKKGGDQDVAD